MVNILCTSQGVVRNTGDILASAVSAAELNIRRLHLTVMKFLALEQAVLGESGSRLSVTCNIVNFTFNISIGMIILVWY